MLKAYLPVLFFMGLGLAVGILFRTIQFALARRHPSAVKEEPYECGLPSEVRRGFRFGISFYLVAMLFLLFDVEIVLLYPIAVQIGAFGVFALVETVIFIAILAVAYVFAWKRGAFEWR